MVKNFEHTLTDAQRIRANTVTQNLLNGAPAFQKTNLPSCSIENANITKKFGREISDAVAHWIKEGFACGPFDQPPLDNFRVNSILAVPQEGKVRPVLNVSLPDKLSFNSNIEANSLEKIHMSSAREVGYLIRKCGKNALMSKSDLKDAYKNLYAKIKDLRLQGFKWLNKFFIDLTQIFGAKSARCCYNQLGQTVKDLAVIVSNTP